MKKVEYEEKRYHCIKCKKDFYVYRPKSEKNTYESCPYCGSGKHTVKSKRNVS
jgi:DNA-directed RNA polymerase subunit RPC12/RpoP